MVPNDVNSRHALDGDTALNTEFEANDAEEGGLDDQHAAQVWKSWKIQRSNQISTLRSSVEGPLIMVQPIRAIPSAAASRLNVQRTNF